MGNKESGLPKNKEKEFTRPSLCYPVSDLVCSDIAEKMIFSRHAIWAHTLSISDAALLSFNVRGLGSASTASTVSPSKDYEPRPNGWIQGLAESHGYKLEHHGYVAIGEHPDGFFCVYMAHFSDGGLLDWIIWTDEEVEECFHQAGYALTFGSKLPVWVSQPQLSNWQHLVWSRMHSHPNLTELHVHSQNTRAGQGAQYSVRTNNCQHFAAEISAKFMDVSVEPRHNVEVDELDLELQRRLPQFDLKRRMNHIYVESQRRFEKWSVCEYLKLSYGQTGRFDELLPTGKVEVVSRFLGLDVSPQPINWDFDELGPLLGLDESQCLRLEELKCCYAASKNIELQWMSIRPLLDLDELRTWLDLNEFEYSTLDELQRRRQTRSSREMVFVSLDSAP